ncbi:MAG: proline racemase family protein [Anaerovoracaceae bacterium]|jgi:proline racemase
MKAVRTIRTIETHTLGQPTRNVVGGIPPIPGKTMQEKFEYLKANHDSFRTFACWEPRGNDIMSGTLFTEPCTPGTDIGIIYFESSDWMPMCGHDTIGATVALIESGMIPAKEPVTKIALDTAAGVVNVEAEVRDGSVQSVSFLNAPSMVLLRDAEVETEHYGKLTMDVSWGGNVYAILPASAVGLEICPANCRKFIEIAREIGRCGNEQLTIRHPELSFVDHISHVEFYGPPKSEKADVQNCVVALPSVIDRSPCGTGTSAKAALLHEKGELAVGESFVHESVIGSLFRCTCEEELEVGGKTAIRPKVTGNAAIIGFATWLLDPKDPFPNGFQVL